MTDQISKLNEITEMNKTLLQQHVSTLLLKEKQQPNKTTLYLTQAAELIPNLIELDGSRPAHQKLIRLLEKIPTLHPEMQMSMIMGLHQTSTQNDIEETVRPVIEYKLPILL